MIIKAQKNKSRLSFRLLYLLIPILLAAWLYQSFNQGTKSSTDLTILCDAEYVKGGKFISKDYTLDNGKTQSSDRSYSGKYSSKLDKDHSYGMTIKIPTLTQNQRYTVSIRRWTDDPKNLSALSVSGNEGSNFHKQTSRASDRDAQGWELLKLEFVIPKGQVVNSLKIYPIFSGNEGSAYFDDLRLETFDLDQITLASIPKLHFYLDNRALKKIETKRAEAIELGILKTGENDWAKAKLTIDDDDTPVEVKVRLKGDWTDHLDGAYYSYRVKMPSDRSWNQLQTFSLQDPNTRFYLHEWLYHKALEQEDILTPRYGFVLLKQNTKQEVLYAYEEHFEKQIAEYKNRREGVIVKFAEDSFWDQLIRNREVHEEHGHRVALPTAEVLPFKRSRIVNNPKLKEQYVHASKLLNAFRSQNASVTEVFDIDRLAKYLAITDIFEAHHGTVWSNLRFYYNPITRKLEPIGFDGYTELGPMKGPDKLFCGEYKSGKRNPNTNSLYTSIFKNSAFNLRYTSALLKYSSKDYLQDLFNKHLVEIYGYESQIQTHIDSNYQFDISALTTKSRLIRNDITPYFNTSLKVYKERNEKGEISFWSTNHHSLPLEVIGSGIRNDGNVFESKATLVKSNELSSPISFTPLNLPEKSKYVFYVLPGLDSIFSTEIYTWQRPSSTLNIQYSMSSEPKIPLPKEAYVIAGKSITIKSGIHTIESPIVIPSQYSLLIEEGSTLDFINKAYLLSYGSIQSRGTKDSPIYFLSSDKSAQGITVLQANESSTLSYTSFNNLNTLEENEWQLTGAVTFYESDVKFNKVTISNNHCEDALNLVRSNFFIQGLNINHTFADGFDGDFCKGTIKDSYLFRTGNDGLDFSGSWVSVDNLTLDQIGDKGISAGEEAHLSITNTNISNAQIGIASKDLSEVSVKNTSLKDCNQGFAAYRKKPEFGGGKILIESYQADNVSRLTTNDNESTITLPQ